MTRLSEKGISFTAGFFMLIAFGVGGMFLSGLITIPLLVMMTGKSLIYVSENLTEIIKNPAYYRSMQVAQTISAIVGFLVPTLFTASRLSRQPVALTGFHNKITGKHALLTVLIMACGLWLSTSLGYLSYKIPLPSDLKMLFDSMESEYAKTAIGLLNFKSIPELIVSVMVLALVPAICEEAFFRGGLQNYLYRSTNKMWLSIIIVSVIFSAAHFSAYGFLSRLALGIILGLIFHYSGNLWLSILAHFLNNAAAVIYMYVLKMDGKSAEEIISDKSGNAFGFLVLPLIVLLFIQFKKTPASHITTADGV